MITVRTPTGDKFAETLTVRTPSGDKEVSRILLRTRSGDKEVYSQEGSAGGGAGALTASASPASAVGGNRSGTSFLVTSNTVTVTATGGTAPYTFAWVRESGSEGMVALTPSSDSTAFRGPVDAGTMETAIFVCTVTDAIGRTGSVGVEVTLYNFDSWSP